MTYKYVCRESYGPFKRGDQYAEKDVPVDLKDTGIFVRVGVEDEAPATSSTSSTAPSGKGS